MEKLNNDEFFYIIMKLDLPDIFRLCETNKIINNKICKRDILWINMLNKDFLDRDNRIDCKSYKDLYILLWALRDLKKKIKFYENIYTLYMSKRLSIWRRMEKIPSSIRFLTNLEELNMEQCKLKEIPNCLPNSLRILNVYFNKIKKLPDHLPPFLEELDVSDNKIKKLPDYLTSSLKIIYAEHNQLEELPEHLPPYLVRLDVGYNNLQKLPICFPKSLKLLDVNNNPLKENEINRIITLYPHLKVCNRFC